ncbi:hypothetical protein BaRGS_00024344 [Batillaria attramentaria]|uniref:Uncharacterized protein n=1 Tax=Batillaria attramentaria TaxID=370345 RepID=A0ABD0KBJ3_9CAEN
MTELIHKQSGPCVKSELDLFRVPPTQTAIEDSQHIEHRPLSTVTDTGPVEFFVSSSDVEYIDPSDTYLYVKLRVLNGDGTNLANDPPVGPENLLLHTLWSQIDLSLNETIITNSNNTYSYRAYLETLLSYGTDAKNTHLQAAMWYKDRAGQMEAAPADNHGLRDRRRLINQSRSVELMGRLHLDFFQQEKLLVNGVSMKLRLVRSRDAFSLHSLQGGADFKINIEDISLFVRKVKINPSIQMAHLQTLQHANIKYPLKRVVTKVFAVPQGALQINKENLFLGQLPTRLVIGLTVNHAFHGSYEHNPFNFQHFNMNYICLNVGGRSIPAKPLTPNFGLNLYARSYLALCEGVGKALTDEGNNISYADFGGGFTLFAFDLTADQSGDAEHAQLIKQGTMRLEIHFAQALADTINIVAHAEFQNLLEVDKHRNILVDFTN